MTIRELISTRNLKLESYEEWLDRLRRENQESERQRAEAREKELREMIDRNQAYTMDQYAGRMILIHRKGNDHETGEGDITR